MGPKWPKTAFWGNKRIWWLQFCGSRTNLFGNCMTKLIILDCSTLFGQFRATRPTYGSKGHPEQRNGSIALPGMCPDLFHLYSTLFRQFRATRPTYGSKMIIWGPFGVLFAPLKGPPDPRNGSIASPGMCLDCSTTSETPDLLMAPNGDFGRIGPFMPVWRPIAPPNDQN